MDVLDKILKEHSWKFPKGYPDISLKEDRNLLESIVNNYLTEEEEIEIETEKDILGNTKIEGILDVDGNTNIIGNTNITGNLHITKPDYSISSSAPAIKIEQNSTHVRHTNPRNKP